MTPKLTKEQFLPLLNKKIEISFTEDDTLAFELIEIKVSPVIESLQIEPFSLLFRGSASQTVYQQGNYRVRSPEIGELSIFLTPRQPDQEGIYYEAIFN